MEPTPYWEAYALSHGDGLHPLQWLTSFFLHANLAHLLGNLMFLLAFGMAVEARVGHTMTLVGYLLTGVIQNAIEQILFLAVDVPISLGASSAIYGLMAMALLWCPQDHIRFFYWVMLRFVGTMEIPILLVGMFYVFLDLGVALFSDFEMGTSLLHVMGAAVGGALGILALRLGWVETENRDLFSMVQEARGKPLPHRPRRQSAADAARLQEHEQTQQQQVAIRWKSIDMHLRAGNVAGAVKLYQALKHDDPQAYWPEESLLKVINLYHRQKAWTLVAEHCRLYLTRYHGQQGLIALTLAKIQLERLGAPRKAIQTLQSLDGEWQDAKQRSIAQKIVDRARREIADGGIELED